MSVKVLHADKILLSGKFVSNQAIIIEHGKIIDIAPLQNIPTSTVVEEIPKGFLIPGLIDIQVNGGGGALFNDDPSVTTIETIGTAHRKFGTTTFFPTLISDDLEKISMAIAAVDEAIRIGVPGVAGIHIEGPFLSKEKKGIHDAGKFKCLKPEDIKLLSSLKSGKTLITLAPETNDGKLISQLVKSGIIIAAGHSNASYEQTIAGVKAGITGFTHLYNAMSPFQSREPGVVGAAFESTDTWASIIADGFHVHPAAIKHAIKTKGIDKTILITDAMPTVGSSGNEFWLGDEKITAKNGKCTNESGVLAGSDLDMIAAVKYISENVGYSLEDAVQMASLSPAAFMGIDDDLGSIAVGKTSNFILMNEKFDVLNVWIDGVQY